MKKYFKEGVGEEYLKLLSNTAAISVIFGVAFFLIKKSMDDLSPVKILVIASILAMAFIGAIINAQIFYKRSLRIPEELQKIPLHLKAKYRLSFFDSLKLLGYRMKIIYKRYRGLPLAVLLCGIPLYISIILALSIGVQQALN